MLWNGLRRHESATLQAWWRRWSHGTSAARRRVKLDLSSAAQRDTLETALATAGQRSQLVDTENAGFYRLHQPDLPGWRDVVDEALRLLGPMQKNGAVPRLTFNPASFVQRTGRLEVFLPPPDAALMHLAHPLMRRALGVLDRRYPGESQVSRWTVRRGGQRARG